MSDFTSKGGAKTEEGDTVNTPIRGGKHEGEVNILRSLALAGIIPQDCSHKIALSISESGSVSNGLSKSRSW